MHAALLSLLAAAPALAAVAEKARTTYHLKLDDFSPLLIWDPPVPAPENVSAVDPVQFTANTWNAMYTGSSPDKWEAWHAGVGDSYHYGYTGHTMTVTFEGTSVTVNGMAVKDINFKGDATLKVDDQDEVSCTYPNGVLLCTVGSLGTGLHKAVLTVKSGSVAIDSVELDYEFPTSLSEPIAAPVEEWQAYVDDTPDNININITNQDFVATVKDDVGPSGYPRIYANTSGANVQIQVPLRTVLLELWGAVDYDHQEYTVAVSPPPPVDIYNRKFTSFNPFTTREQILYAVRLEPDIQYSVRYTHMGNGGEIYTDLSKFKFIKDGGSSTPKKSSGGGISAGAIAGIVVGVVLGLLIVGLLVWFFCIRRKREAKSSQPLRGTIDNDDPVYGPQPTPLQAPPLDSNQPLLPMRNTPHGTFSVVSGHTSSSGDAWGDVETASATTAGMAGFGAGGRDAYLNVPAGVAKARMARQEANNGQGSFNHVINQHADAGVYTHNPATNTVVEEVPPSYNPDWVSSGPSEAGGSRTSEFGEGFSALSSPPPTNSKRD